MLIGRHSPPPATGADFSSRALKSFDTLDIDKDGLLRRKELDQCLLNPDLPHDDAAVLATLYRRRQQNPAISRASNDQWGPEQGISKSDLQSLASRPKLNDYLEETYTQCKKAVRESSPDLFAGSNLAASVSQGSVPDCWWLSSIVGTAVHDPQSLRDAIETLEDGRYRVTFPDQKTVTVDPPTVAEMATFATSGRSGHWLTALEKARGVANQGPIENTIPQLALDGASPSKGIRQTTGGAADGDWLLWTSVDSTRSKMSEHLENKDVVLAATGPGIVPHLTGHSSDLDGLVPSHVYTVLKFDPEADTITLRNPWGDTEWKGAERTADDGVFQMPFERFHGLFANVAYQVRDGGQ